MDHALLMKWASEPIANPGPTSWSKFNALKKYQWTQTYRRWRIFGKLLRYAIKMVNFIKELHFTCASFMSAFQPWIYISWIIFERFRRRSPTIAREASDCRHGGPSSCTPLPPHLFRLITKSLVSAGYIRHWPRIPVYPESPWCPRLSTSLDLWPPCWSHCRRWAHI